MLNGGSCFFPDPGAQKLSCRLLLSHFRGPCGRQLFWRGLGAPDDASPRRHHCLQLGTRRNGTMRRLGNSMDSRAKFLFHRNTAQRGYIAFVCSRCHNPHAFNPAFEEHRSRPFSCHSRFRLQICDQQVQHCLRE